MSIVPKLSVGLPVYNGSAYVAESIEALLGQTFEDFELIISDNASTDDTGDICRRYEKRTRGSATSGSRATSAWPRTTTSASSGPGRAVQVGGRR